MRVLGFRVSKSRTLSPKPKPQPVPSDRVNAATAKTVSSMLKALVWGSAVLKASESMRLNPKP